MKVRGKITHDKSGVKIRFSTDLVRLLNWYLLKETGMILHTPLYGAKVGLYNPKLHTNQPTKLGIKKWVDQHIMVDIDPSKAIHLFSRKGYWVHWVNIECPNLWKAIVGMGLEKNFDRFQRPHMSISNGKYFVK